MNSRISVIVLCLLGATMTVSHAGSDFSACWRLVDDDPDSVEAYLCFRRAGRSSGQLQAALLELDRLELTRGPDPRLTLARGGLLADLSDPRAMTVLAHAADDCRSAGFGLCEAFARLELAPRKGRWDPEGSDAELDRVGDLALTIENEDLKNRVRVAGAWKTLRDDRPAVAGDELRNILNQLPEGGPANARVSALEGLGFAAWSTGRMESAREYYRTILHLAEQTGDSWLEARALASFTLLDLQIENPKPEAVRERLANAVDSARQACNPEAELKLRVLFAQTLSSERDTDEWQRVSSMARRLGAVEDELLALRYLARCRMRDGEASQAITAMDEAQRVARVSGLRDAEIRGCAGGLELRWADSRIAEAREQLGTCLDLIDKLRDRQVLPAERARVTTRFSHIPRNAADALLGFENDIEGALRVLERYRARSLEQGILTNSGAMSPEHSGLRRQVTRVQLQLAYGRPAPAKRHELEVALERLEADELKLARASAVTVEPGEALVLAEIEELLDDQEALVVFSTTRFPSELWQTTGCWAIVVTSDRSWAVRLPKFDRIGPAVDALAGLLDRTDGVALKAAARVYELLFREVSAGLGNVRHLTVLLDDPLHDLPLAALRPTPDSAPIISRFDVQFIPCVGTWLRRRRQRETYRPNGSAVVVANPLLAKAEDDTLRGAQLPTVAELGRLPGASKEGGKVARLLGRGTRLLVGGSASEAALRDALSDRPRVLHIAAHAVVDGRRPERSAIVLAPGHGHDGLLQARDIAGFDLDGSLVVLSACRSLDGEIVDGDGVIGLGRAFLEAGARAVVGAMRPLDDRRTPELMKEFYRGLGDGATVARALAEAQQRLASRGRPASEWAPVLLVGDGAMRIAPLSAPKGFVLVWGPVLAVLAAVVAVLLFLLSRRSLRGRTVGKKLVSGMSEDAADSGRDR